MKNINEFVKSLNATELYSELDITFEEERMFDISLEVVVSLLWKYHEWLHNERPPEQKPD